jgi:hypothetical protein
MIYGTFLKVVDPANSALFTVLNVNTLREETMERQGKSRRAFDGTWLSTEREYRLNWTANVRFMTPAEVEAFRLFVSSGTDLFSRRLLVPRVMFLQSSTDGALRGQTRVLRVMVEVGAMVPTDYLSGASGGTCTQFWDVDLTIREA